MIEGGLAGGSAAHHADQRRTVAARLVSEAAWLEAVAQDERSTGELLAQLPQSYALLHDLKLPGTQGNIDHVVVGPGGAFLVVTRRFADAVEHRDGVLYAGGRSLESEFAAVTAIASQLRQALDTPVVPVMGFHGAPLSPLVPPTVSGVLVCSADSLVRVISRGSHTLLPPHQVTEVVERALPLLFNPGSVPRGEVVVLADAPTIVPGIEAAVMPAQQPAAPAPAPSVLMPPPAAPPPAFTAFTPLTAADIPADPPPTSTPTPAPTPTSTPTPAPGVADSDAAGLATASAVAMADLFAARAGAGPADRPADPNGAPAAGDPTHHRRSKGFVIAVVLSICLVAATLGAAASMIWKDDKKSSTTVPPGSSTTVFIDVTTPLAANLPAPKVEFSAVCPAAGTGWQLVASWPGDLDGLVQYDVDARNPDGSWTPLAPLLSSAVTVASMQNQAANATVTFRITAVMADGSRSINQPTPFTTPTSPC